MDKKQVYVCLVADYGSQYMYIYDVLPSDIRLKLQHAQINYCSACVYDALRYHKDGHVPDVYKPILDALGLPSF